MKRVTAQRLVLVNWKGVFYQRYLLDKRVTALEGENGAGKTTVMIAAYVALLPDLNRLRFVNVGEQGTTTERGDRGVHGRLGDPNRPSYVVLDFELTNGDRFIAGVHLEAKPSGKVEASPFTVHGLAQDVRLQDVLLVREGDTEFVPLLGEMTSRVAVAGGQLKACDLGEYFAALFDQGVTPLRLATDEERNKFNQMLRTCMQGGISQSLTTGLREFLFRREPGLVDNLKQMRGNLEACRRTRREVEDAAELEKEIRGVYEAGEAMFAAAALATRARADETRARRDDAILALDGARVTLETHKAEAKLLAAQHDRSVAALEEGKEQHAAAIKRLGQVERANAVEHRLRTLEELRENQVSSADASRQARVICEEKRRLAKLRYEAARESVEAAAEGLANFQEGFQRLSRRAAANRMVREKLAWARKALEEEVAESDVTRVRLACWVQVDEWDRRILHIDRTVATADRARNEVAAVTAALGRITGRTFAAQDAFSVARDALADLRARDQLAAEREELPRLIEEVDKHAERQRSARSRAGVLAADDRPMDTAAQVAMAHRVAEECVAKLTEAKHEVDAAGEKCARDLELAGGRIAALSELQERWFPVRNALAALAERRGASPQTPEEVQRLHRQLVDAREVGRREQQSMRDQASESGEHARRLEQAGGDYSPGLLRTRDALDGVLLATRYESVELAEASTVEALLGPMRDAIVVENPRQAVDIVLAVEERPETVWLLDGRAESTPTAANRPPGEVLPEAVVIESQHGIRVSRFPSHPVVGRKARAERVQALLAAETEHTKRANAIAADLVAIEDDLGTVTSLLGATELIGRPDPAPEIERARNAAELSRSAMEKHRAEAGRLTEDIAEAGKLRAGLAQLLPNAHLLDEPDYAEKARGLRQKLTVAREAHAFLEGIRSDRELLALHLDVLRVVPPSADEVARLRGELNEARSTRDRVASGLDALTYVDENIVALQWMDAEAELREQGTLQPALEKQYVQAKKEYSKADASLEAARVELEEAQSRERNDADDLKGTENTIASERKERAAFALDDASDEAVARSREASATTKAALVLLEKDERHLDREKTRYEERIATAAKTVKSCEEVVARDEQAWKPAQERWERLRSMAAEKSLLGPISSAKYASLQGTGSPNLHTTANQHRTAVVERLSVARDGSETIAAIHGFMAAAEQNQADAYLQAWLAIRDWLHRRVPPQVTEVADPVEALSRVSDHLDRLKQRLLRQESELRGKSSDVARGIEIMRRRAFQDVLRLSNDFKRASFGDVAEIRMVPDRVQLMEQVLATLRGEEAQKALFESSAPLEEAIAKLFEKPLGGRILGERALDYREHIDVRVEIRRKSDTKWEKAEPGKVSTGEGIGIGASVMMVILAAWERDGNQLRGRRSSGTLRMLFLDEANRLDQNSLRVIFELCESLDLQLVVAAPEVAEEEGNTTYRLARVTRDGRSEVEVNGRRMLRDGDS